MNHLTTSEVFQLVDERLANGDRAKIVAHLEACPRCRQEVEFQRRLSRAVRSAPLVRPSVGLRDRVLNAVVPQRKKSLLSGIVNNLGSILGMAMVLTVVWYAATTTDSSVGSAKPSVLSEAVKTYVAFYASARDFVVKKQTQFAGEPSKQTQRGNEDVIYLTIASIVILVAVDRFIVRRLVKIRL